MNFVYPQIAMPTDSKTPVELVLPVPSRQPHLVHWEAMPLVLVTDGTDNVCLCGRRSHGTFSLDLKLATCQIQRVQAGSVRVPPAIPIEAVRRHRPPSVEAILAPVRSNLTPLITFLSLPP